jgi:hypothetical protein
VSEVLRRSGLVMVSTDGERGVMVASRGPAPTYTADVAVVTRTRGEVVVSAQEPVRRSIPDLPRTDRRAAVQSDTRCAVEAEVSALSDVPREPATV